MDLWNEIITGGATKIQSICDSHTEENQRLEFKQKQDPTRDSISRDDKGSLGETLSGMSNAEGGILLFGIVDEKIEGIDCAKSVQPIQQLSRFAGTLKSLVSSTLSPPNADIEVLPIVTSGTDEGVVAVRVGASTSRPHMSVATGHHRYYLRAGFSNLPMVDFQVRDMLRVVTAPILSLRYVMKPGVVSGAIHESRIVVTLVNEGRVSAHQPYVLAHPETRLHAIGPVSSSFVEYQTADTKSRGFQSSGRFALHPGQEVLTVAFLAHVTKRDDDICLRLAGNKLDFVRHDQCGSVPFKLSFGAENLPATEVEFVIEPNELEEMAERILRGQSAIGRRRFGKAS